MDRASSNDVLASNDGLPSSSPASQSRLSRLTSLASTCRSVVRASPRCSAHLRKHQQLPRRSAVSSISSDSSSDTARAQQQQQQQRQQRRKKQQHQNKFFVLHPPALSLWLLTLSLSLSLSFPSSSFVLSCSASHAQMLFLFASSLSPFLSSLRLARHCFVLFVLGLLSSFPPPLIRRRLFLSLSRLSPCSPSLPARMQRVCAQEGDRQRMEWDSGGRRLGS